MVRFAAASAAVFVVGYLIQKNFPQNVLGFLEEIGLAGILVSLIYYFFKISGRVRRLLLWKVRNKIIVAFAFVGLVPVAILALIGWLSFRWAFGQVSALYLDNEIRALSVLIEEEADAARVDFYTSGARSPKRLADILGERRQELIQRIPDLAEIVFDVWVRQPTATGYRLYSSAGAQPRRPPPLPAWALRGFNGLVNDHGKLYFRCLMEVEAGVPAIVSADLIFDDSVVRYLEERTSITLTPPNSVAAAAGSGLGVTDLFQGGGFGTIKWMLFVTPVDWDTGSSMPALDPGLSLFAITVPIGRLYYDFYFKQKTNLGRLMLTVVMALGIVFILVELGSLVIGIVIARSITRSIQRIYLGTQRIQGGEFGYQIPAGDTDQLDTLAQAFNQMSTGVTSLMRQLAEKERLEKEIEIAREVQNQLFPQVLPRIVNLQLSGRCLPARRVSGDYYDFIPYGHNRVDVVIADISGKGISAALLMASLQSAIRTHVVLQTGTADLPDRISRAVRDINGHLYAQTAADKYATLFYCEFESETRRLTYCNAGHNPPLWVSKRGIERLTVGGMAAGLFDEREYEQESVRLEAGDLVVLYTDGVVEAESPSGEMFGEDRLIALFRDDTYLPAEDIQKLILDAVSEWAGGGDQRDDITVVVLKVE